MQAKIKPEKPQKFTDLHICWSSILEIQKMALFFWRYHVLHFLYTIVAHLQWQDDQRSTQLKHQNLATKLSQQPPQICLFLGCRVGMGWLALEWGIHVHIAAGCNSSLLLHPPQAGGPACVTVEEDGGDDMHWCFSTAGRYNVHAACGLTKILHY